MDIAKFALKMNFDFFNIAGNFMAMYGPYGIWTHATTVNRVLYRSFY